MSRWKLTINLYYGYTVSRKPMAWRHVGYTSSKSLILWSFTLRRCRQQLFDNISNGSLMEFDLLLAASGELDGSTRQQYFGYHRTTVRQTIHLQFAAAGWKLQIVIFSRTGRWSRVRTEIYLSSQEQMIISHRRDRLVLAEWSDWPSTVVSTKTGQRYAITYLSQFCIWRPPKPEQDISETNIHILLVQYAYW